MRDPQSCKRETTWDRGQWHIYDDPFGAIYTFSGKLFGAFLPGVKDEDVEKFQSIIETGGSSPDWYEDVVSIFTRNSFRTFLLIISLILMCCSALLSSFVYIRFGCRKIMGSQPSKNRENRCQLLLRLGVVTFLFGAILWCEIMYGVALAQMDREQRALDLDMRDTIQRIDKYQKEYDPGCPFEESSMSKEGIIDYFEGLNRGILDKCNPTDSAENNRTKRVTVKGSSIGDKLLPPGMETMIQAVLNKAARILSLINSESNKSHRTPSLRTVQQKKWLEQVVANVNELQKSIRSSQSIPDLQNSPTWRIRKQREKILLDAQTKTLSATMDFYNLAEMRIERGGMIERRVMDWLRGIAAAMRNGYLEQIHTPRYNVNYAYYQGTIGAVAAVALFFLAVAFFATLYKIVFINGNIDLRKQERTVGTLFYAGFFFFALSSGFLSWTLNEISKPAMVLRGSCDALFTDKDFSVTGSSFYARLPGVYNWSESIFEKDNSFPKTFRETMEKMAPRELLLYRWDNSPSNNRIVESLKKWRDDLPSILEDLQAAEMYPFKISTVKRIRSAMYGLINVQESQDRLNRPKTAEIDGIVEELLSDLAYFDFPMKQNNDFKPGNTRENDWIYDFATTRSYYGWDYNRQNQQGQNTECGSAVGKYQENVGKMGDMLIQYIQNVTSRYNGMFSNSKDFHSSIKSYLCETLADPSSSLLFFYLINMLLWLVAMVFLFKIARGWDLGYEKRTVLISSMETILTPLIDSDKLEEAIHNNPMAEI